MVEIRIEVRPLNKLFIHSFMFEAHLVIIRYVMCLDGGYHYRFYIRVNNYSPKPVTAITDDL